MEQNVEKVKNDLNTRLQDIEQTQYEILDFLKKQKKWFFLSFIKNMKIILFF